MIRPPYISALLLGSLLFAGAGCFSTGSAPGPGPSPISTPAELPQPDFDSLGTAQKTPHFVSSTPVHGATFAAAPVNVVIDVDLKLGAGSEISVLFAGAEFGRGETLIDENKLAMRRPVDPDAPDGLYTVIYKACWADGGCEDGRLQFFIDRVQAITFESKKDTPMVEVHIVDDAFVPKMVRVSVGTTIVWINDDDKAHYVTTDPPVRRSYFPRQSSDALQPGEEYAVTFDEPGHYLYHCGSHAATMEAEILVE